MNFKKLNPNISNNNYKKKNYRNIKINIYAMIIIFSKKKIIIKVYMKTKE